MARRLQEVRTVGAGLLLVDDEPGIRRALTRYFELRGFTVDCAAEREEAEALLSANEYACVIADLELTPWRGAEGLQLLNDLRAMAPSVRTILLTGYGSPEIEDEARRHGVHAFLRKPIRLGQLEEVVRQLLAHTG
jgi:DNA-binding NtrC family response regulator